MAQAYVQMPRYRGLAPSPPYVCDLIQQLALIEGDVLDIVGADVLDVRHDVAAYVASRIEA